MDKKQALKEIWESKADDNKKNILSTLVVEFEEFKRYKALCGGKGLMEKCFKNLGIRFLGMYGVDTIDDLVELSKTNGYFLDNK